MNRFALSAVSALILGTSFGAGAVAQQAPGMPPAIQAAPPQSPSPSRSMPQAPTEQQIVDEVNARIALLKANLRLSEAQSAHWAGFETALRDARVARAKDAIARQTATWQEREAFRDRMRTWREERGRGMDTMPPMRPQTPRVSDIDVMRTQADAMAARAAELRKIADAAAPLYDSLDDSQRNRLINGLRMVGQRGMGGREGRWGRGGRGGWED